MVTPPTEERGGGDMWRREERKGGREEEDDICWKSTLGWCLKEEKRRCWSAFEEH